MIIIFDYTHLHANYAVRMWRAWCEDGVRMWRAWWEDVTSMVWGCDEHGVRMWRAWWEDGVGMWRRWLEEVARVVWGCGEMMHFLTRIGRCIEYYFSDDHSDLTSVALSIEGHTNIPHTTAQQFRHLLRIHTISVPTATRNLSYSNINWNKSNWCKVKHNHRELLTGLT